MNNNESDNNNLSDESLGIDLECESTRWIIIAIEQKNPRLTIGLAHSILLLFDEIDKKILIHFRLN